MNKKQYKRALLITFYSHIRVKKKSVIKANVKANGLKRSLLSM